MPSIYYADYYLPDLVRLEDCISTLPTNWLDEYETLGEFHADLRNRYGFDRIAVGGEKFNSEVLTDLVTDFLDSTKINADKVSYIISTDFALSYLNTRVNMILYLQKKLGFKKASIFSLGQQCGASCLAVGIAATLVSRKGGYIIILSQYVQPGDTRIGQGYIIGDGAGILVVSEEPAEYEIVDFASISNGFGSYSNYTQGGWNYLEEIKRSSTIVHIKGVNFIRSFLARNGLVADDVYMMIVQAVNRVTYIDAYARLLGIPGEKIFLDNIANGGHLGNADIPRNFKDFNKMYTPPQGANILFYAASLDDTGDISNNIVLLRRTAAPDTGRLS